MGNGEWGIDDCELMIDESGRSGEWGIDDCGLMIDESGVGRGN